MQYDKPDHTSARHRRADAGLIEDIEWIAGWDSPEHIARRVGYNSWNSLERQLRRLGRLDLIAIIRGGTA